MSVSIYGGPTQRNVNLEMRLPIPADSPYSEIIGEQEKLIARHSAIVGVITFREVMVIRSWLANQAMSGFLTVA